MNAACLTLESFEKYGTYTAFQFEGRDWSNVAHLDYAGRMASVLRDRGIAAGDHVVALMPNRPEVLAAFQAIWRLGAVITPVTPQLGVTEIRYVLEHSEAKAVIASPELVSKAADAAEPIATPPEVLTIEPVADPRACDISVELDRADAFESLVDRQGTDLAMLLYTSGTTGRPKGVMLSHENILTNHRAVAEFGRLKERSQTILVLPLSHSFGVLMMNQCALTGCSAAVLPKFDAPAIAGAIDRYGVTRFSVVPTMLVHLVNLPGRERYDTSSLEIVNTGGAILPNEVRIRFEAAYQCRVLEGYGLSECAPTATSYPAWEQLRPGSIGKPIPGVTVTIQNPEGNVLPPRAEGEICIRGPNVMRGYWKDPDATAEALRGGWLHSGDIGYMDGDGYVFLTDRKKDLIIKGGENISPREIEDAIYSHPAVNEVIVVGLPDEVYGEHVAAAVVCNPGASTTGEELLVHAAKSITKFKLPSRVVFRESLPRNANGKIDRRRVRRELAAMAAKGAVRASI